jgi:hypothetical protein
MNHDTNPHLEGLKALVGVWDTEAVHPMLPDTVVPGRTSFEWLEGERFLVLRSRNEHPQFPDSICVMGATDDEDSLTMHYFDSRGVFRLYRTGFKDGAWKMWGPGPSGHTGRFSGQLSDDGATISGLYELSADGSTWRDDLAITYRRVS